MSEIAFSSATTVLEQRTAFSSELCENCVTFMKSLKVSSCDFRFTVARRRFSFRKARDMSTRFTLFPCVLVLEGRFRLNVAGLLPGNLVNLSSVSAQGKKQKAGCTSDSC